MTAIETIRALEALRRGGDAVAREISDRLRLFNESPSAGDYCAQLDLAASYVEARERDPDVWLPAEWFRPVSREVARENARMPGAER